MLQPQDLGESVQIPPGQAVNVAQAKVGEDVKSRDFVSMKVKPVSLLKVKSDAKNVLRSSIGHGQNCIPKAKA